LIEAVPSTVTFPEIVPPDRGKYKGENEDVAAYEALKAVKVDILTSNVLPSPLIKFMSGDLNEAVITKDPVSISGFESPTVIFSIGVGSGPVSPAYSWAAVE
jgi:hypothetical protein